MGRTAAAVRAVLSLVVAWVAAGCGSVNRTEADAGDRSDSSVTPDGPRSDATPPCRWTEPDLLANVNGDGVESAPSLSDDARELYFVRYGTDAGIYLATRSAADQIFDTPDPVDEVTNPDQFEYDPEISSSRLEIFFRWGTNDIWVASRQQTSADWGDADLTGLAGQSPSISGDGQSLYFIAGDMVQVAKRSSLEGSFGDPEDVMPTGGMNAIDVSADERKLLLSRGPSDFDGDTVLVAERSSPSEPFGTPVGPPDFRLEGDISIFHSASWNGDATQMVLTYQLTAEAPSAQIYLATCE